MNEVEIFLEEENNQEQEITLYSENVFYGEGVVDVKVNGKSVVNDKIAEIEVPTDFVQVVQELPEIGVPNKTYFVAKASDNENDLYDEYMWVNKGSEEEPNYDWEYLGTKTIEIDLTEYVKFTDIASGDKAGVVKLKGAEGIWLNGDKLTINEANESRIDSRTPKYPITPSNLDYAIKSGLSANKLEWTADEKANARTVIDAVGSEDYATAAKGGVVLISKGFGIATNAGGYLMINPATETDIDEATNTRLPITTTTVDYAIKKGLSNNALEWTDEEKQSARYLLGVSTEVTLTQAEYDALETKDENTYYYIVEE